jgi:hypothetical protein
MPDFGGLALLPLSAAFLRRITRSMGPWASCLEPAELRGSFAFFYNLPCADSLSGTIRISRSVFTFGAGMRKLNGGAKPDISLGGLPD